MYKYFSTNQFKNVIKAVHERANYHRVDVPELNFLGTVKLHGTNSSVYSQLNANTLVTQSKNNIITPSDDNNGFSAFAHQPASQKDLKNVFEAIKAKYPEHVDSKTAVIYGEWCGGNIQPNVALSKLSKMFVVFAVKLSDNEKNEDVADIWLQKDDIKEVLKDVSKENRIHNIYDFQTWEVKIDMANPKMSQNKLIDITNSVEQKCPVSSTLGSDGIGEGVVWKCISNHPLIQTDDLVFKVKGKEHSVSHVKTIAEVDVEKVSSINEFVEKVVTENRLNQAVDYLKEQHLDVDVKNMGTFLKWIADDSIREESDILEESGLNKKEVTPVIQQVAKKWFFAKISEDIAKISNKKTM